MTDEDAELKDVLIRSLNETGILPRLQAQLRAAVYLALEKHNYHQKIPPPNVFLKNLCSTEDGSIILSLIAEFLSYANLGSTLEVFKHEAGLNNVSLVERATLHSLLNLDDATAEGSTLVKLMSSWRSVTRSSDVHATTKKKEFAGTSVLTHALDRSIEEDVRSNGCGDESTSDAVTENGSRSSTARSVSTPVGRPQSNEKDKPDFVDPLLQLASEPENQPSSLDKQSVTRPSMTSGFRVNDLQPNPSPREPEYQDDFESPRSQGSSKTLSSQTEEFGRSRGTPHSGLGKSTNHIGSLEKPSADRSNSTTPVSLPVAQSPSPSQRPDSRSSSPSVIRLYTRFKKPSPSDEASSDVDGEDEISELVKELEYSGEEDTVDQTIDSDESLHLDHVEEVMVPRKSISPSA